MMIYVAGPYRGSSQEIEDGNVRFAKAAAKKLWGMGWTVICPHQNTHEFDKVEESLSLPGDPDPIAAITWGDIMRGDLELVAKCDAIFMLSGWMSSRGAMMEHERARELGLKVHYYPNFPSVHESDERALQTAQRLISGVRDGAYGHPLDDFLGTAKMWNGLWWRKLGRGQFFGPWDIPQGMNCVKLSREQHQSKPDNWIDGAGYWGTVEMVYREIARRGYTVASFSKEHFGEYE